VESVIVLRNLTSTLAVGGDGMVLSTVRRTYPGAAKTTVKGLKARRHPCDGYHYFQKVGHRSNTMFRRERFKRSFKGVKIGFGLASDSRPSRNSTPR